MASTPIQATPLFTESTSYNNQNLRDKPEPQSGPEIKYRSRAALNHHYAFNAPRAMLSISSRRSAKRFRMGNVGTQRGQKNTRQAASTPQWQTKRLRPESSVPGTKLSRNNYTRSSIETSQSNVGSSNHRRGTWPAHTTSTSDKFHHLDHIHQSESNSFSGRVSRFPAPRDDLAALEELRHPNPPKFDDVMKFWESYNKMADFEDKGFVKSLSVSLDALLIFAGLFSAVDTAFIIEALPTLREDKGEITNNLIRSVVLVLHNSTFPDDLLHNRRFDPSPEAFRSTAIFFVSLCFSLTAASGAVLSKQWLSHYEREGGIKPPASRGRERQKKYEARGQWQMEAVIETLPTLLQASLFLFLIALLDFLWLVNSNLAFIVLGFSLVPALFYVATTTLATICPTSPFQTRLSITLRLLRIWTLTRLAKLGGWFNRAWNRAIDFVFGALLEWRPPLGVFFAFFPMVILLSIHLPIFVCLLFIKTCRQIQRLITSVIHHVVKTKNPIKHLPQDLSDPNDIVNVQCLDTFVQHASFPQDLAILVAAINSLAPSLLEETNHPSVKSLFKSIVDRVIPACHSSSSQDPTSIDWRHLLKILHPTYAHFGYGYHHGEEYKYLLSHDGDKRLMQELFDSLFPNLPDGRTASMVSDTLATSALRITSSEANIETLCQILERPSSNAQNYLPYITLLSIALHDPARHLTDDQRGRIHRSLVASMRLNNQPDLGYDSGRLRLRELPEHLDSTRDEYQFSNYLVSWRSDGPRTAKNRFPAQLFDYRYVEAISQLLDFHTESDFWPEQLEKDGHVLILLGILEPSEIWEPGRALYSFLRLWDRRRHLITPGISEKYMNTRGVECVVNVWERDSFYLRDVYAERLMVLTVSYLEEAKRCGLLGGQDLRNFVREYKMIGGAHLEDFNERRQVFERVDRL